ncbi:hypothetical protein QQ045_021002 [Rhodiola kirilowii]
MDGETVEKRTMLDRISDLPNNVIDIILSCVPLRVAVRTSTLSRNWRLHWIRAKSLVLDGFFLSDIFHGKTNKIIIESKYLGIVGNILLSQIGPIHKFFFCTFLVFASLSMPTICGYLLYRNVGFKILHNWLLLKEWGEKDVPKMLPAPLENNLSLTVYNWNTYSLAQVRSMFCLINSFPSLRSLDIEMCPPPPNSQPHDTSDYLKSQIREAKNLWSLRTARVTQLMGNEPEMIFIEIILIRCPMLEKLYLSSRSHISSDAELKMMTEIMRFRRASAQAEMIYSSRSSLFPVPVNHSHLLTV